MGHLFTQFILEVLKLHSIYQADLDIEYRGILFTTSEKESVNKLTSDDRQIEYENRDGLKFTKIHCSADNNTFNISMFLNSKTN